MSFRRKNSRRLKALRRLGIPVDGDGRLTGRWDKRDPGVMVGSREQRAIIAGTHKGWN